MTSNSGHYSHYEQTMPMAYGYSSSSLYLNGKFPGRKTQNRSGWEAGARPAIL